MKKEISVIILGLLLILQSCSAPTVKIVTDYDQRIYQDSEVTSEKKHAVSISHYKKLERVKSNTLFQLVVENRGEKPLLINNDNVSIIFKGSGKGWNSKKISIQPLHEFMKDISDDYYYEEARIISAVIRKASEADMVLRKTVSEEEVLRVVDRVNKLREELSSVLKAIPEIFLKPRLIKPYKSITGIVACDTRELPEDLEGHFRIVLSIDEEEHEFTFSRSII